VAVVLRKKETEVPEPELANIFYKVVPYMLEMYVPKVLIYKEKGKTISMDNEKGGQTVERQIPVSFTKKGEKK
jgi:hypothetical protein